jgi:hypothetical protein
MRMTATTLYRNRGQQQIFGFSHLIDSVSLFFGAEFEKSNHDDQSVGGAGKSK